jgi:hypothetical protein
MPFHSLLLSELEPLYPECSGNGSGDVLQCRPEYNHYLQIWRLTNCRIHPQQGNPAMSMQVIGHGPREPFLRL